MNMIRKFFCLLFISLVLLLYCVNLKSERRFNQQNQNLQDIEFIEIRRLNVSSNLKEVTVVTTTKDMKEIYRKLDDSEYSKSVPIPVLENDIEFF